MDLSPTRSAGLAALDAFLPRAGRQYQRARNDDRGPGHHTNVSCLSPYVRHRLILEREVAEAAHSTHGPDGAEKFIAEVFWRTYFKGFLERRPTIWSAYKNDLDRLAESEAKDGRLAAERAAAEAGNTGIDAFDHWARELTDTGYLHNHARMWFASIWIFTLRLPWQWGADFLLRHLIDGDPASNTLSWRWVGGLHTKGKTYLARPDNIARYTAGRFCPQNLATEAPPLLEDFDHPLRPAPIAKPLSGAPAVLLISEEDGCADALGPMAGIVAADETAARSTKPVAERVQTFANGAIADAVERAGGETAAGPLTAERLIAAAQAAGVSTIATAHLPVGPAADALAAAEPALAAEGIAVERQVRDWDAKVWPYADKGFFKVKKVIPKFVG
ncbi:MAG: FAD-binding domain-containing protein [Pseudomonadota bacterium]